MSIWKCALLGLLTGTFLPAQTIVPHQYSVEDAGAVCDAKSISGASVVANWNTLHSASAEFTSHDVGKRIAVYGVGGGSPAKPLFTTITKYHNSTEVTLGAIALATTTNATAVYGTDNTTVLQNAVNALKATGGTLSFSQGLCGIGHPGWSTLSLGNGTSNLTLTGKAPHSGIAVLYPPTETLSSGGPPVGIYSLNGSQISIEGLEVNMAETNANGIGLEHCTGCTVKNNTIHDTTCYLGGDAIAAAVFSINGSGNTYSGNEIYHSGRGLWIGNDAKALHMITDASIAAGSTALTSAGEANWTSADVGAPLIVAAGGPDGAPLTTFISAVQDPARIMLGTPAQSAISGGRADYGQDDEVEVNAQVLNNFIHDDQFSAIGGTMQDSTISGNNMVDIDNQGSCIPVASTYFAIAQNLTITGNTCQGYFHGVQSDVWPVVGYGSSPALLQASSSGATTVTGNTFYLMQGTGVYAYYVNNWTVDGNTIRDVNQSHGSNTPGIEIVYATNSTFSNNQIIDDQPTPTMAKGFEVMPSSTSNSVQNITISGNQIKNATYIGIHLGNNGTGNGQQIALNSNQISSVVAQYGIVINFPWKNITATNNTASGSTDTDCRTDIPLTTARGNQCGSTQGTWN